MKIVKLVVQILSVISVASFAGAMLMLDTSLVAFWKQVSPDEFLDWFSAYSSGISRTTGIFVKLSMLLPLISLLVNMLNRQAMIYWSLSYICILAIMVITATFFVDANESFVSKTIELGKVPETITTWGRLHAIRTTLAFVSAFLASVGLYKYVSSIQETSLIDKLRQAN
ncbi:MAG: DUF1772 domain-containing protein [Bacteroidia bacterium]|nr:DUF1772 domain-containing protein [Bacteroidia bacterium]